MSPREWMRRLAALIPRPRRLKRVLAIDSSKASELRRFVDGGRVIHGESNCCGSLQSPARLASNKGSRDSSVARCMRYASGNPCAWLKTTGEAGQRCVAGRACPSRRQWPTVPLGKSPESVIDEVTPALCTSPYRRRWMTRLAFRALVLPCTFAWLARPIA